MQISVIKLFFPLPVSNNSSKFQGQMEMLGAIIILCSLDENSTKAGDNCCRVRLKGECN